MPLPPGRGICSVDGCGQDIFTARGWCVSHYNRWRKYGDPLGSGRRQLGACTECGEPERAKGLCVKHYQREAYRGRRLAAGKPEPSPETPTCRICLEPFTRSGRRDIYCGSECAKAARHLRALEVDYGLTREEYLALLRRQGGVCAVCHKPDTTSRSILHVDHCHETGKVRGLLCHHCNVGLGHFKDDPTLLRAAANYLGA